MEITIWNGPSVLEKVVRTAVPILAGMALMLKQNRLVRGDSSSARVELAAHWIDRGLPGDTLTLP